MKLFRRYWAAVLILMMVGLHAAIIGYVRSQVARLKNSQSTAVLVGSFRIQPLSDPSNIYTFHLHAVLDPSRRNRGEERLEQVRLEILESTEQLLRQVEPAWLQDPTQTEVRSRLLELVTRHLNEPLVQRVLITDWIQVPLSSVNVTLAAPESTPAAPATIL